MQIKELELSGLTNKLIFEVDSQGNLMELDANRKQDGLLQKHDLFSKNLLLDHVDRQGLAQSQLFVKCRCQKSQCTKNYCQCLLNKTICGIQCRCLDCHNVQHKIGVTQTKRTKMVKPKQTIEKGCHCVKSQCQKKYCQCFQNNKMCTTLCVCLDCKNINLVKLQNDSVHQNQLIKEQNAYKQPEISLKGQKIEQDLGNLDYWLKQEQ